MPSPFLYHPHASFSPAELSAARLDGHLAEIGDAYLPADAVETAQMRAASLGALLGDRLAAALLSAAWVHGALPQPPARHTVARAVRARVTTVVDRRLVFHDLVLDDGDLIVLDDVAVTTPTRTLVDLARRSGLPSHAEAARALVASGLAEPDEALRWYAAHARIPDARRATDFLRALQSRSEDAAAAQDEVTR